MFGALLDYAAAIICVAAGVYLLQYNAAVSVGGTSWFQIIGHGMGIYFIGKGIFVARSTRLQAQARDRLAQLVSLQTEETRTVPSGQPEVGIVG
ncbi:MAG: hypothetical protein V4529_17280 [Gemmatimonadota bacterium]